MTANAGSHPPALLTVPANETGKNTLRATSQGLPVATGEQIKSNALTETQEQHTQRDSGTPNRNEAGKKTLRATSQGLPVHRCQDLASVVVVLAAVLAVLNKESNIEVYWRCCTLADSAPA